MLKEHKKDMAAMIMSLLCISFFIACDPQVKQDNESQSNNSSQTDSSSGKQNVNDGFVYVKGKTVNGSDSYAGWNNPEQYPGVFTKGTTTKIKSFYISPYELTKKEYKEIMEDTSLNTLGITSDPSKPEWYYPYSGSNADKANDYDSALDNSVWYKHNICNNGVTKKNSDVEGTKGFGPHQVGLKNPNSLGLYDMSGNVCEWSTDGIYQEYVNPATQKSEGYFQYYYQKDGCFSFNAHYIAITHMFMYLADGNSQRTGMRLCRNAN